MKRITKQEFIERAIAVHGDKYAYEDIEFTKMSDVVKNIYCKQCQEYFDQIGSSHIMGFGCNKCARKDLWENKRHKMTKDEFIKEAKQLHNNKYDYSLVEYKDKRTNVKIKCNVCGTIFEQSPFMHLKGQGCPKCRYKITSKKLSLGKEKFIEKARKVHGNKYDYNKVEYVNNQEKVCIICPEHGEFWQIPNGHLRGNGCPKCSPVKSTKYTTKEFKERMDEIFGDKYDFSKSVYIDRNIEVDVYCPIHGWFRRKPASLLYGFGCPKCGREIITSFHSLTTAEFIKKARKVHGDKYDYSNVNYTKSCEKVTIKCPIHGNFLITPNAHLRGSGCSQCGTEKRAEASRSTKEEFVDKAIKIHGNAYKYDKFIYINAHSDSEIFCNKHQSYFLLSPSEHLCGVGCPKCNRSHMEKEMSLFLEENNINYIEQYRKNLEGQSLDFYLPDYNIAIECQGIQHFKPVYFGKTETDYKNIIDTLKYTIECDVKKYNKCNNLGIKLLYYTTSKIYKRIESDELKLIYKNNLYKDKNILLKIIKGEA